MFGVAVFSLIFSSFKNTLDEVGNLNSDIDESHHLSSFICFLKNFNNQEQMDQKFKKRIEKFFKYKWKNDRNYVMRQQESQKMLEQLPLDVQVQIFTKFLFSEFMITFKSLFKIRKWRSIYDHCYFNNDDQAYQEFQICLL